VHQQSQQKRLRSLNFARIKNHRKGGDLLFQFKGDLLFLSFFDAMKTEQARALPSFSHGPHSKQEDVSRILQILASVCNAPAAAVTTTTAAKFLCSDSS
jgi:hypothetical protein